MFSSGALKIPEVAWLAAHLAKEAFAKLKEELSGLFDEKDLDEMERRFFYYNAKELYNFD